MPGFQALDSVNDRGTLSALKFSYQKENGESTLESKSSMKMTLQSGWTRFLRWRIWSCFGGSNPNAGKSDASMIKNTNSIKAILDYIGDQSNSAVRNYVENHSAKLDGDRENDNLTVKDRQERASFVTKGLVQRMKALAIDGVKEENLNIAETFLGSANPNERILQEQGWNAGRVKPDQVGQRQNNSPLANLVLDVCEGSHKALAKPIEKYPQTWGHVYNSLRNAGPDGEAILELVRKEVSKEVAMANARGELVDPKNLEHAAIRALTNHVSFFKLVQLSNQQYRKDFHGLQAMAQEAANLNSDAQQQQTLNSLARVVRNLTPKDFEDVDNTITQDQINSIAKTFEGYHTSQSFLDYWKNTWLRQNSQQDHFDETLDQTIHNVLDSLDNEVTKYLDKSARKNFTPHEAHEFTHSIREPEELNDVNFGKKAVPDLADLIHAHLQMGIDAQKTQASESEFQNHLKTFPHLQALESKVTRGTVPGLERGKVEKTSEFVGRLIDQYSDQFTEENADKISGLKDHLTAFDKFEDFQRQLQAVNEQGGVDEVDNLRRQNLEDLANTLEEHVTGLKALIDLVDDIDNDALTAPGVPSTSEIGTAVLEGADQIHKAVKNYTNLVKHIDLNEAQAKLRQLPHLQQIRNRIVSFEVPLTEDDDVAELADVFADNAQPFLSKNDQKHLAAWRAEAPQILNDYAHFTEVEGIVSRLEGKPSLTEVEQQQLRRSRDYVAAHRQELRQRVDKYVALTYPLSQLNADNLLALKDNAEPQTVTAKENFTADVQDFWQAGRMMQLRLDAGNFDNTPIRFAAGVTDPALRNQKQTTSQWIGQTKQTVTAIAQTVLSKDAATSTVESLNRAPLDIRHGRRFRNDLVEAMREFPVPENSSNENVEFLKASFDDLGWDIEKLRVAREELKALRQQVRSSEFHPDVRGFWLPGDDKPTSVSKASLQAKEQLESKAEILALNKIANAETEIDSQHVMLAAIYRLDQHYQSVIDELTTLAADYNSYVNLNIDLDKMDKYVPPQVPAKPKSLMDRLLGK